MISISLENNRELYTDYQKCLEFCRSIPEVKLDRHVNFHCFWYGRFARKQLLFIKSYLATQDLENTRLTLWSTHDLTTSEYLKPYLKYIDFKLWNPYYSLRDRIARYHIKDLVDNCHRIPVLSDLFRIATLHDFGGVYFDMDIVLLRDMAPLLSQEFIYQWGDQLDNVNNAVLHMFKEGQFAKDAMKYISMMQHQRGNSLRFNSDLFRKVREYNKSYTIFPSAFFNTEWQITTTDANLNRFIKNPMKRTDMSKELFNGAFSWHWHNKWKDEIEVGSKWEILERMMNKTIAPMMQHSKEVCFHNIDGKNILDYCSDDNYLNYLESCGHKPLSYFGSGDIIPNKYFDITLIDPSCLSAEEFERLGHNVYFK